MKSLNAPTPNLSETPFFAFIYDAKMKIWYFLGF